MPKLDDYRVGVDARNNRVKNVGIPKIPTDGMPFRVPNLTTTERNALPDIQEGLLILNTTDNKAQMYINSSWTDLN